MAKKRVWERYAISIHEMYLSIVTKPPQESYRHIDFDMSLILNNRYTLVPSHICPASHQSTFICLFLICVYEQTKYTLYSINYWGQYPQIIENFPEKVRKSHWHKLTICPELVQFIHYNLWKIIFHLIFYDLISKRELNMKI